MSRGKHGRLQADVPAPASCQEPGRSRRSSCPALERASGARRVLACEPACKTVLSISMNIHAVRPAVAEALTAPFLLMPLFFPIRPPRLSPGFPYHGVFGAFVVLRRR